MEARPRRQPTNSTARDATQAIEATLRQFGAWRTDLASISVRAERRSSAAESRSMLARCDAIEVEVQNARIGLLKTLIDAPRSVAGHSRVADVEKALDGIDRTVADIRRKLA